MSMKDLNTTVKELIDKEIERAVANIKNEVKEVETLIDRKIEELRQYLKT